MSDPDRPRGGDLDLRTGDVSGVDVSAVLIDSVDATAVDPVVFANMIRTASDTQLEQALASAREKILDEVFRRMEEHFDSEQAPGGETIMNWRLGGRPDGGHDHYQVIVRDGACVSRRGGEAVTPTVTFELPAISFLRLASGNIHGAALYLSGELKIEGDVAKALSVQRWFRIPEPTIGAKGGTA